jgi:hypothetical protein
MSIAQIEKIAARLNPQERTYLRVYLAALARIDSESFKRDIARRRREMKNGQYVTSRQLKRLHHRLEAEGL